MSTNTPFEMIGSHPLPEQEPGTLSRRAFVIGMGAALVVGSAGGSIVRHLTSEKGEEAGPIEAPEHQLPPANSVTKADAEVAGLNADVANKNADTRLKERQLADASKPDDPWKPFKNPETDVAILGAGVTVAAFLLTLKQRNDTERARVETIKEAQAAEQRKRQDEQDAAFAAIVESFSAGDAEGGRDEALLLHAMPGKERYFESVFTTAIAALGRNESSPTNQAASRRPRQVRQNLIRAATTLVDPLRAPYVTAELANRDHGHDISFTPMVTLEASNTDLTGLNVAGRNLSGIRWTGSTFSGTVMHGAVMDETEFQHVDATGAVMEKVRLSRSNCEAMNLRGANLRGATITDCNLAGVTWDNADVVGATIRGWGLTEELVQTLQRRGAKEVVAYPDHTSPYQNAPGDS